MIYRFRISSGTLAVICTRKLCYVRDSSFLRQEYWTFNNSSPFKLSAAFAVFLRFNADYAIISVRFKMEFCKCGASWIYIAEMGGIIWRGSVDDYYFLSGTMDTPSLPLFAEGGKAFHLVHNPHTTELPFLKHTSGTLFHFAEKRWVMIKRTPWRFRGAWSGNRLWLYVQPHLQKHPQKLHYSNIQVSLENNWNPWTAVFIHFFRFWFKVSLLSQVTPG